MSVSSAVVKVYRQLQKLFQLPFLVPQNNYSLSENLEYNHPKYKKRRRIQHLTSFFVLLKSSVILASKLKSFRTGKTFDLETLVSPVLHGIITLTTAIHIAADFMILTPELVWALRERTRLVAVPIPADGQGQTKGKITVYLCTAAFVSFPVAIPVFPVLDQTFNILFPLKILSDHVFLNWAFVGFTSLGYLLITSIGSLEILCVILYFFYFGDGMATYTKTLFTKIEQESDPQ